MGGFAFEAAKVVASLVRLCLDGADAMPPCHGRGVHPKMAKILAPHFLDNSESLFQGL